MKNYLSNTSLKEGVLSKFPILVSLGLASVLGLSGGTTHASSLKKPINVSTNLIKVKKSNSNTSTSMFDYISQWEGVRNKVYKDHAGNPTIGIGHYLNGDASDKNLIEKLFNKNIDYEKLLDGTQTLTDSQVRMLFNFDIKSREKKAKKLMPEYDSFDQDTKNAIINALFRGDLGPKTIKHINNKDWNAAAREYLNHNNFKSGPDQIKRRMQSNANLLLKNVSKKK